MTTIGFGFGMNTILTPVTTGASSLPLIANAWWKTDTGVSTSGSDVLSIADQNGVYDLTKNTVTAPQYFATGWVGDNGPYVTTPTTTSQCGMFNVALGAAQSGNQVPFTVMWLGKENIDYTNYECQWGFGNFSEAGHTAIRPRGGEGSPWEIFRRSNNSGWTVTTHVLSHVGATNPKLITQIYTGSAHILRINGVVIANDTTVYQSVTSETFNTFAFGGWTASPNGSGGYFMTSQCEISLVEARFFPNRALTSLEATAFENDMVGRRGGVVLP